MKEKKFIQKHISSWTDLKNLIILIEKHGYKKLKSKELRQFLHLFRQASHHLAYARTHFPNSDVTYNLNVLVGKSHNHIYIVKKYSLKDMFRFLTTNFPKQLYKYRLFFLSAFIIFFSGFLFSLIMVLINSNNASYFLPKQILQNIDWDMSKTNNWDYPLMSSFIMVNNIGVAFKAFVYGISFGLGTIYVLFYNGVILGSLTGLVYRFGNPTNYWSLILPHGFIELTAIFISGTAGLLIARGILLPGKYSRKHSLVLHAKQAIPLVMGTVIMLIIAGIIEGFFTPTPISPYIKLVFAVITFIGLALYFSIAYFKSDD